MKNVIVFLIYFSLGFFLIFSFKKVSQILNSQQLKTPLPQSSFSLEVAPEKSLRGTIILLSGDVGWQSRMATEPAQIAKPMQVQQGEEIETKKTGQATVIFSNIARLAIHPKTTVNFIQTLPVNILIGQDSGIVKYSKLNDNSLNVRSLDLLININQGEIIVSVSEDQPYIVIDVETGSITAGYNDINYITRVISVSSGNRLVFRTDTKKASLVSLQ